MNRGVLRIFSASFDPKDEELLAKIAQEELAPALDRTGATGVKTLSGVSRDGKSIEACIVAQWSSVEQSSAAFADSDVAQGLYKLLSHARGDYDIRSYFVVSEHGGVAQAVPTAAPSLADALVAPARDPSEPLTDAPPDKKIYDMTMHYRGPLMTLKGAGMEQILANPIVRSAFLGGAGVDMIAAARERHREIADGLLADYSRTGHGAVDDLAPGVLDPKSRSAHHFFNIVRMRHAFPDLRDLRILEVGGGFGNTARLMMQLGLCRGYRIVDIGGAVELQKDYLAAALTADQRGKVEVLNIESESDVPQIQEWDFDLLISVFGLSEVPPQMRDWYVALADAKARYAYIAGSRLYGSENVVANLQERLSANFTVETFDLPYRAVLSGPPFEIVAKR
jgi:hypothetical protein